MPDSEPPPPPTPREQWVVVYQPLDSDDAAKMWSVNSFCVNECVLFSADENDVHDTLRKSKGFRVESTPTGCVHGLHGAVRRCSAQFGVLCSVE